MEEGTLAAWALKTCVSYGEKLVITDPKQNHSLGSSGYEDGALVSLKLARFARGGYIKEFHHPVGQRRRFREMMIAYHGTVLSSMNWSYDSEYAFPISPIIFHRS